ncbi:MAG: type II toxin-antitoxin system death-on-curing family toxin [Chloroflexi bacterium]|nr:type II toxin-antitoxin system death-on-curing family toxin [Chloroflexota bacterium]MBK6710738.1 type II toxin-antitoxin system death-on-curing family toxin [Chloroflexota bacterium]MBK7917342.1 type II toxin-antitoxin system death-on-curing family toxin [Chloroflexota bacterium]MBP6804049.1 type II toxin-antitoxin system death-on-curing family toxin [Chloroflexota bacterium]MBP7590878.1 type II toxin-antitoxin system death-on-curing family toxin [Chloroflexota bacterium]
MVRYLTLNEVLTLHDRLIAQTGGSFGVRDIGRLESSLAQPRMTFDGVELYPTLVEKAATLGFSIIQNHPFLDGNKRTGHAAMEIFLFLNGFEIRSSTDEQEKAVLQVASGKMSREEFSGWVNSVVVKR